LIGKPQEKMPRGRVWECGLNWTGSWYSQMAHFFEHCSESSESLKAVEFLDLLRSCQVFKEGHVPCGDLEASFIRYRPNRVQNPAASYFPSPMSAAGEISILTTILWSRSNLLITSLSTWTYVIYQVASHLQQRKAWLHQGTSESCHSFNSFGAWHMGHPVPLLYKRLLL
jgi:hypothetical protein